jgi:F420-non-reducing hydrogenase small subunit
VNPEFVIPMTEIEVAGERLTLPEFYDTVKTLNQTVDVDYYVPGCPPVADRINDAVGIIAKYAETGELPPKGIVVAFDKTVCDECPLEREEKKLKRIYRPYEIKPEPSKCLLDQGILCLGPATRGGCGARCPNVNMPCRGCMGPTAMTEDHGAAVLSMIASILGVEGEEKMTGEEVEELVSTINDQLGTFYRFTLPASLLRRVIIKQTGVKK